MGCDGGTIPRRDELVRVQKKPEQVKSIFFLQQRKLLDAFTVNPVDTSGFLTVLFSYPNTPISYHRMISIAKVNSYDILT